MKKAYATPATELIRINVEDIMSASDKYATPEIPISGLLNPQKFN